MLRLIGNGPASTAARCRMGAASRNDCGRYRAVKIYFVARSDESSRSRVTQGVVERDRWVMLKKELAAEGLVVTYWCSLEDDVAADAAA